MYDIWSNISTFSMGGPALLIGGDQCYKQILPVSAHTQQPQIPIYGLMITLQHKSCTTGHTHTYTHSTIPAGAVYKLPEACLSLQLPQREEPRPAGRPRRCLKSRAGIGTAPPSQAACQGRTMPHSWVDKAKGH